jgi:hypothetical protein
MYTKIVTATVLSLTLAGAAVAEDSQWQKDHPRREQVNNRLANQNARIDKKVANGQMSKAEAAKLHSNDHAIRQEERDMAKQNGGHITKQEQKTLNQQENANSKQIAEH